MSQTLHGTYKQSQSWAYTPRKPELKETRACTPMFTAAPFMIARTWKQPRCPSADKWIRKLWYTQWNITQPLKRIHLNQF